MLSRVPVFEMSGPRGSVQYNKILYTRRDKSPGEFCLKNSPGLFIFPISILEKRRKS